MALEGATTLDRDPVLRAVLRSLTAVLEEASRDGYRALCATLGSAVRVELPDGDAVTGTATAVDDTGRLVVDGTAYSAGDVVHLR
jgi:BirA family biotin operon repressor/biotin-[acetyl-CoA-carboxylase] ligase